jgi:HSP20 family molecular chaperone IbpA
VLDEFDELFRKMREFEKKLQRYIEEELTRALSELKSDLAYMENMFKPMSHYEGYLRPLYTIRDRGSYIEVYIDLPKADEKTIDIRFRDNYMLIRARLKEEVRFSGLSGRGGETKFHEYREVLELPIKIDPDKVRLDVKKGRVRVIIYK